MFKINDKDTPSSSISIVKFEQVNADWDSACQKCLLKYLLMTHDKIIHGCHALEKGNMLFIFLKPHLIFSLFS